MLDGQQSDEQYMRELYLRFLSDVKNNNNSEFYEEDELLDIYDYAQDEGDEMVQLYVLLTGARLYPDSDFLDERKAFFLSTINDQAARNMLDRHGRRETALWGVLRLMLNNFPDGNPESDLADLLTSGVKFSCESVIRLIDTLHDLGRDDLIAESLHIIEERAENRALLYYEAAEALYNNDRYVSLARDIADELTQQEPFNPDNWILLAKIEFAMEHINESVAAADYALALDPSSINGRLVKGIALVTSKQSRAESIELLRSVLTDNPDNAIASRALAEAYSRDRKKKAALEVYYAFMERDEANNFVILDALKLRPSNANRFFELFDKRVGCAEQRWLEVAVQLANHDFVDQAAEMLAFFHSKHHLHDGMEYFLSLLYRLGLHQQYAQLFGQVCAEAKQPGVEPVQFSATAYLLLAAAYLKSGLYEEAKSICNLMLKDPPTPSDHDESLRWRGIQVTLQLILKMACNPELIPSDESFDPLMFNIRLAGNSDETL